MFTFSYIGKPLYQSFLSTNKPTAADPSTPGSGVYVFGTVGSSGGGALPCLNFSLDSSPSQVVFTANSTSVTQYSVPFYSLPDDIVQFGLHTLHAVIDRSTPACGDVQTRWQQIWVDYIVYSAFTKETVSSSPALAPSRLTTVSIAFNY